MYYYWEHNKSLKHTQICRCTFITKPAFNIFIDLRHQQKFNLKLIMIVVHEFTLFKANIFLDFFVILKLYWLCQSYLVLSVCILSWVVPLWVISSSGEVSSRFIAFSKLLNRLLAGPYCNLFPFTMIFKLSLSISEVILSMRSWTIPVLVEIDIHFIAVLFNQAFGWGKNLKELTSNFLEFFIEFCWLLEHRSCLAGWE